MAVIIGNNAIFILKKKSDSPELPANGLLTQSGDFLVTQSDNYIVWG